MQLFDFHIKSRQVMLLALILKFIQDRVRSKTMFYYYSIEPHLSGSKAQKGLSEKERERERDHHKFFLI